MDLKGKVLVMMNNDPDWDPKLFEGNRRLYYGRWTYKYESAARQGAAGAIIIHTTPSAGYPWQVVQTSWSGEQFELPAGRRARASSSAAGSPRTPPRKLLQAAGKDLTKLVEQAKSRDFKPVPLGITTSLTFSNKITRTQTANVLGLLPGSDPQLKDEMVVYTAHHDHLGIGQPDKTGDKIYNGAVDNASGCAEVLAIAKAFAALPQRPRRSILIAFVAAEEQGLLGSAVPRGPSAGAGRADRGEHQLRRRQHPRPHARPHRHRPRQVVARRGRGSARRPPGSQARRATSSPTAASSTAPTSSASPRSASRRSTRRRAPTSSAGRRAGARSRWRNTSSTATTSRATSSIPNWNYDGMIEDAQLGFYAGLVVADAPKMPTWNPGDEFEAARKKALAEVAQGK